MAITNALIEKEDDCANVLEYLAHFANPVRLRILCELSLTGDCSVGHLVSVTRASQPAVSQQLRLLRLAGLVSFSRSGNSNIYSVTEPLVHETMAFLESLAAQLRGDGDTPS